MKPTLKKFYVRLDELINLYNPDFQFNGNYKVSSILLFKEGLIRINEWRSIINSSKISFNDSEDFNLFNDINAPWINEIEDYSLYVERIKEMTINYNSRNFNFLFIYLFIYWEIYQSRDEIRNYGKENPYIPLVKIFKNKNLVYFRDWFQINGVTMKKNKITHLPSLDDSFLNFIDSKCELFGSTGIPSQEKINELWEEFQN